LMIYSKIFEYFIVIVILLSCILLCIDTPLEDPNTSLSSILLALDLIFLVIFIIEATLKIIALGFFWNQYENIAAYIRNPWNVLDFIVVVVSLVDTYYELSNASGQQNLSSLKALRAIRALRPLRIISKSKDLKIAIFALFSSSPSMGNVLLI
jgi:voltage-dependent calcium channel L type alpha-1D